MGRKVSQCPQISFSPKIPATPATLAEYQATMGGRSIISFHRPVAVRKHQGVLKKREGVSTQT